MQTEAIILAGGLGTRLREAVPELPKCLAPVAGQAFLGYLIDYLSSQGVRYFIFSLGYRHEMIETYLKDHHPTLEYSVVIEEEPLGTGGAIKKALEHARERNVFVTNGDTLFKVDLTELEQVHANAKAEITLALKPMEHFTRYGSVSLEGFTVKGFSEKTKSVKGLINGGLYLINREKFLSRTLKDNFSFENDYLSVHVGEANFAASVQDKYFIDIGIPEDFEKAGKDLARPSLDLRNTDKSWTLFLDRDGVINNETLNEYVLNWKGFVFSDGVLKSFARLTQHFARVIVITNQRGVTKGLMSAEDLAHIHQEMQREVKQAHGHIEAIYHCVAGDNKDYFRKPNPGMAFSAFNDFPEIDPAKTIMVGNKPSDMRFGRRAGIHTVFVKTTNPQQPIPHPDIDLAFPNLQAFTAALDS